MSGTKWSEIYPPTPSPSRDERNEVERNLAPRRIGTPDGAERSGAKFGTPKGTTKKAKNKNEIKNNTKSDGGLFAMSRTD